MRIDSNSAEVANGLLALRGALQRDAAVQAVNRTAAKANTQVKREVSRAYALKYGELAPAVKVERARRRGSDEVDASVIIKGARSRNVILFLERSVSLAEARRRRKSGTLRELRFTIRRDRPRQSVKGAFVLSYNGGTFVAQRIGARRYPLRGVRTIGVPGMYKARRVSSAVLDRVRAEFGIEVERAVRDALRRAQLGLT